MIKSFSDDLYRKHGRRTYTLRNRFTDKTLKCLRTYRYANYYWNAYLKSHSLVKKLKYYFWAWRLLKLKNKYAFTVPPKTKIGNGLFIGHNGPLIINAEVVIGKNCNIGPNVVIGQENRGKRKGTPVIGDKVWIGSNAVIVGKITIGNNVLIAPGAYVNFDVPSNTIVVGNPGKMINSDKAVESYIENEI